MIPILCPGSHQEFVVVDLGEREAIRALRLLALLLAHLVRRLLAHPDQHAQLELGRVPARHHAPAVRAGRLVLLVDGAVRCLPGLARVRLERAVLCHQWQAECCPVFVDDLEVVAAAAAEFCSRVA